MHELLRQFAGEHLAAVADERAAVAARHSAFYLQFVAAREARLAHNEPREAAAEIRSELDNIRQAWEWAAVYMCIDMLDASTSGLWQFYYPVGFVAEGADAFRIAGVSE